MRKQIDSLRSRMVGQIRRSIKKLPPEKRRKKAASIIRKHYPLVLMFHSVLPQYGGEKYTVSTATVERIIRSLLEDGYSFAFEDEFFHCEAQSVILTFDDGFANNYTEVFPLLKKYRVKASVNMITGRISDPEGEYLSREQITEMEASGLVQFQSHTCSHRSLTLLTPEEVRSELSESKRSLQSLIQGRVSVFAYPREKFTEEIAQAASEYYDLCYGWASEMQLDRRFTLPRIEILENAGDYASQVLFEYRIDRYHKLVWSLRKSKPQNVYRRVLFSRGKQSTDRSVDCQ